MKRILSFALCAVMLASMLCGVCSAAQYNPEVPDEENLSLTQSFKMDETFDLGDVNGDGKITALDLALIAAAANNPDFKLGW